MFYPFKEILSQLDKLTVNDRRFIALVMFTGMRKGEALGLKWNDIDFEKNEIHISRNVTYAQQNSPTVTTPKTKAGKRTLPLDSTLEKILHANGESGFIFGGEKPITASSYRHMNNRIHKKIDLHGATPHILRHSYLTYAAGETTDLKTVQGISGHSDFGTLVNRYAHPQDDKVRQLTQSIHERIVG